MTRPRILTFGAGLAGAALFLLLGLPLPWLLGPMLGCLIVALSGARMQGAGQFGIFMRTFLGVLPQIKNWWTFPHSSDWFVHAPHE